MAVPDEATDCTLSLPTAVIRWRVLMRHRKTIHMDCVWMLYVWAHGDMDLLRNAARGGSVACVLGS